MIEHAKRSGGWSLDTMCRISLAVFVSAATWTGASAAGAGDRVLCARVEPVDVAIFIPAEAAVVRGVLVHAAHYRLKSDDRWAQLCRKLQFAHVALNIDLKLNNRPRKLRAGLQQGLAEFAQHSGHPELVHAPRAGVGHSAGGMVTGVLLADPASTITNCVSCGWILDPAKLEPQAARVPALFTLGAIPDAFKMLPDIEAKFVPARRRGLPWGLGLQWGCAHDFANSATLFVPWIEAVSRMRLPRKPPRPGMPAGLRELEQEAGWLGDRRTTEAQFATIAPFAEFRGDRSQAAWLPDRAVAFVWQALESKDPPVVLEARTGDGAVSLPQPSPKAERGMTVDADAEILLSARPLRDAQLREVRFYRGDVLLGRSTSPPWECRWKRPPQGAHAVLVQYETADGRPGVANPALVCVRAAAR
jgi:hypothetical protein